MKIINEMGYLYRLSDRNYQRLLGEIARGDTYDLAKLGKPIGHITQNITDMSAEDAQEQLRWMRNTR